MKLNRLLWVVILMSSLAGAPAQVMPGLKVSGILCGADHTGSYLERIRDRNVSIVANPTSRIGKVHLVDTLLRAGVRVTRVFAPEHGFRGEEEAGGIIQGGVDALTGLQVVSLYGNHKKPSKEDLTGTDVVIFDIQDVGVRFYTYISTLHLVMEACAESGVPMLLLDRPNPNGYFIDGPVLDTIYRSFVGMHPVPVVHGMTIGEYARMINGEKWLAGGVQCDLTVIPCAGYDHRTEYILPVKPSPNLPGQISVYLYPSLCFFEGTVVSIGRGTDFPFQVYGHPDLTGDFTFTPRSIPGVSLHPPHENQLCHGRDLRRTGIPELAQNPGLYLGWLIDAWRQMGKADGFFIDYFDKLTGTDQLRIQIQAGMTEEEIRSEWQPGLDKYLEMRSKYLLYE
jgi:uncharacterized protein YbbC (DUF1343 family)